MEFRSHVEWSSFRRHVGNNFHVFYLSGKPKISEFEISIVNQDILWFNVSVNDGTIVKHFISFTKLFQKEPYFFFRDIELLSYQILIEVSFVAVLHDEIKVVLRWDLKFHAVNKVGMMGQLLENLDLGFDRYTCLSVLNWDDLGYQVFFGIFQVVCPNNDRKGSLSNDFIRSNDIRRIFKFFYFDLLAHRKF